MSASNWFLFAVVIVISLCFWRWTLVAFALTVTTAQAESYKTLEQITGMPAKGVGPIQEIIEVPTTPPLTIIVNGLGGSINAHVALFWRIKAQGGPVKVIGPCGSACTQVLSFIPKDRLCFGERSFLAFHMVRKANVPNVEETRLMINSYPDDVRDWINAKGGHSLMPGLKGYWRLGAKELWKMGHAKCDP